MTPFTEPARGAVLIVDDEPEVGELLAECLEPLKLDCTVVTSAKQALELCNQRSFSIIFADVRMPDMDGVQFFNAIQQKWPDMAERFVFVSGDVLHRDFGNIAEASGRPVIEKPFNFNLVREAAQTVLADGDAA